MKYRAFGDYRMGYAHVKNGSTVEDCAASYNEENGKYYIAVICDGHSDNNCFRSSKGAQFGCETAVEVLRRFFELFYEQKEEKRILPVNFEDRLRRSLKQSWDQKVFNDIAANPLTEKEMEPLTESVRSYYKAGKGLQNVYGATFLALGVCKDFFLAIHVGDGAILCVDQDGTYYDPLPADVKSETGAPASMCDSDLFTRENAFRIGISEKIPVAATVSSDGIEDCMDSLGYRHFTYSFFNKLAEMEQPDQPRDSLNDAQKEYLGRMLEFYAGKGNGAEDDCSLAGFYNLEQPVPELMIPLEEAYELYKQTALRRNEVVNDYESRKRKIYDSVSLFSSSGQSWHSTSQFMKDMDKNEDQKQVLKTIDENEKTKVKDFDQQLAVYAGFIKKAGGTLDSMPVLKEVSQIKEEVYSENPQYKDFKAANAEYQSQKEEFLKATERVSNLYLELARVAKEAEALTRSSNYTNKTKEAADNKIKETYEALQKENDDYLAVIDRYVSARKTYDQYKKKPDKTSSDPHVRTYKHAVSVQQGPRVSDELADRKRTDSEPAPQAKAADKDSKEDKDGLFSIFKFTKIK